VSILVYIKDRKLGEEAVNKSVVKTKGQLLKYMKVQYKDYQTDYNVKEIMISVDKEF
jgi:hypothetical protein